MKNIFIVNLLLVCSLFSQIPQTGKRSVEQKKNNLKIWLKISEEYNKLSTDKPEIKKIVTRLFKELAKNKSEAPGQVNTSELFPDAQKIPSRHTLDPLAKCIIGEIWLESSGQSDMDFRTAFGLLDQGYAGLSKSKYSRFTKFIGSKWLRESLLYSNRLGSKKFQQIKNTYSDNLLALITHETKENEQRLIADMIRIFMDNKKDFTTIEKFFKSFAENPGKCKPWLKEMIFGIYHRKKAWNTRGNGFASTVSDEDFKTFHTHTKIAGEHFKKAYQIHPERPEAATGLISISTEGGTEEPERHWFNKAVEAEMDFSRAYFALLRAYRPRWGGSFEQMIAFGEECAATELYDTTIPEVYLHAVKLIKQDSDYETVNKMGLYHKMHEVFKKYGKLESENKLFLFPIKNYFRSWHFCYAVKLNKFQHVKKLYELYGEDVYSKKVFDSYGVKLKHELGRAYAMDGPASALIKKIHTTFSWDNVTQDTVSWPTLKQIQNLKNDLNDVQSMTEQQEARPYFEYLNRMIDIHLKYYKGEWAEFTFKEDFPLWKNYGGNWTIVDEKTVRGENHHNEKHYLSNNGFFKAPFMIEVEVESIKATGRGGAMQAGVMVGRNLGRTGRSFWIDNIKKKAGWTVPRESPKMIPFPNNTKKGKLTVFVWDGFFQLYINDGEKMFELDDPKFKTLKVGLGISPTWKITGIAKYSNFRIKKLNLAKPPVRSSLEEKIKFYSDLIKEEKFNFLNSKLGWAYYSDTQYQKAVDHYIPADKDNPDWLKPLIIASSLYEMEKHEDARPFYEKAFKRSRKNQYAKRKVNNYYAFFLSTCPDKKQLNPEKALKLSQESLKGRLDPNSRSKFMSTLACCHAAMGDFKKALQIIEDLLKKERDEEQIKDLLEKEKIFKQNKPFIHHKKE